MKPFSPIVAPSPISPNLPISSQAWPMSTATMSQFSAPPSQDIKIELENSDLWQKFHQHTTEMIVTKSGRRMFPTLRFKVSGLDPNGTYAVFLELAGADDCRYKFQNGRWVVAGRADPPAVSAGCPRPRVYAHPDSPAPGRIWMRQPLSFHRIKLTNNFMDPQGHVLLNSMHKYQPRLFIMRLHDYFPAVPQLVASASVPETAFVAVTAYQNERVIQLKIDHNPFAKGFRESGQHSEKKRPSSSASSELDNDNKEQPSEKRLCVRVESPVTEKIAVATPTPTKPDTQVPSTSVPCAPVSVISSSPSVTLRREAFCPVNTCAPSPVKPPTDFASLWSGLQRPLLPYQFVPSVLPSPTWPGMGLPSAFSPGLLFPPLFSHGYPLPNPLLTAAGLH